MLQVTYSEYKFSFIHVFVGAIGAIPIDLKLSIKKIRFYENEAAKMMKMIQRKCNIGSVKICKTFINFRT